MHPKTSLLALVAFASTATAGPYLQGGSGIQHHQHHHHVARHVGHGFGTPATSSPRHLKRQDGSTGNTKKDRCAAKKKAADAAAAAEAAKKKAEQEAADKAAALKAAQEKAEQEAEEKKKQQQEQQKKDDDNKKDDDDNKKNNDDDGGNGGGNGGGNSGDRHFAVQTGDSTFYSVGLNACGTVDHEPTHIAAVSHEFFDTFPGAGPNPNKNPICGRWLTAHYQGKSTRVKVTDRCGGCNIFGSLDFSKAAFQELAPFSVGRLHGMTWQFD